MGLHKEQKIHLLLSVFLLLSVPLCFSWTSQHVNTSSVVEQHCHLVVLWGSNPHPNVGREDLQWSHAVLSMHYLILNYTLAHNIKFFFFFFPRLTYILESLHLLVDMFFSLHRNVLICVQWTSLIPQRLFINQLDRCPFSFSQERPKPSNFVVWVLSAEYKFAVYSTVCLTLGHICFLWLYVRKLYLYNNDGISSCYIIALFHLALPFCYSLHNISVRKPFDMSNDTKKQKQRKSVEFMDQLSLFCLHMTKTHTHTLVLVSVTKTFTCTSAHTH